MKRLSLLFSTTLFLTFSHLICCLLPYIALLSGAIGLPLYLGFLEGLQPYMIVVQFVVISYNFHYLYFRGKQVLGRVKLIFWITFTISLLALFFPYYQHAQAQKVNTFGKTIIHNIK